MINPNATWIDVNEYMPPFHNEKYIVRAINDSNETFYYGAYLSYCDGCKWYFIAHGDGTEHLTVTHWMKEPIDTSPFNPMNKIIEDQQIINAMGKEPPRNIYEALNGKVYI